MQTSQQVSERPLSHCSTQDKITTAPSRLFTRTTTANAHAIRLTWSSVYSTRHIRVRACGGSLKHQAKLLAMHNCTSVPPITR
eukprot:scaffold202210_cov32-Tisochrysis_lutea.AAC.2